MIPGKHAPLMSVGTTPLGPQDHGQDVSHILSKNDRTNEQTSSFSSDWKEFGSRHFPSLQEEKAEQSQSLTDIGPIRGPTPQGKPAPQNLKR